MSSARARAMRVGLIVAAALTALAITPGAQAAVLRYALVVGTNVGQDADGARRPPLRHAEAEAALFRAALVGRCGFGDGPRTRLLQRPSRASLFAAIGELGAKIAEDRAEFPETEALFLLYFSGHGAEQSILLEDGAVTGRELARALDGVGADLQIRIVDACSSASLGDGTVMAKGMSPTGFYKLIPDLPEQALNASGAVWLFSADDGETAFEHSEIGSLFTHSLIEALTRARRDDFGISLDAVWDYARARTTELAAERGLVQTPIRVSKLRTSGPLHLAWLPRPRATLVLGPEISGTLGLFYGGDQMVTIDKAPGTTAAHSVYSGLVNIMVTKGADRRVLEKIALAPGARVLLPPGDGAQPTVPFGRQIVPLYPKGVTPEAAAVDDGLTLLGAERDGLTVHVGAAYLRLGGADLVATPRDVVSAVARADSGPWRARLALGYGFDGAAFPSWSYSSDALVASLSGGYGVDLGRLRLSPSVSITGGPVWQTFGDGASRQVWGVTTTGGLDLAFGLTDGLAVEAALEGGATRGPGVAEGSRARWTPTLAVGFGLVAKLP